MEMHFKIIGWLLMGLGLIHIIFPRYFNWEKELSGLSVINRQMMYIHTFFIALGVFLMGLLCLLSAEEILKTAIGRNIALGFGLFWGTRLVIQFFGYSSSLWKGKRFETSVHIIFSLLWTYLTTVFIWAYLS